MTMHIDEALLKRVMESTGAASKTEAVKLALLEMDRKAKLSNFHKNGLGLSDEDYEGNYWPDEAELEREVLRNRTTTSYLLNERPPEKSE